MKSYLNCSAADAKLKMMKSISNQLIKTWFLLLNLNLICVLQWIRSTYSLFCGNKYTIHYYTWIIIYSIEFSFVLWIISCNNEHFGFTFHSMYSMLNPFYFNVYKRQRVSFHRSISLFSPFCVIYKIKICRILVRYVRYVRCILKCSRLDVCLHFHPALRHQTVENKRNKQGLLLDYGGTDADSRP